MQPSRRRYIRAASWWLSIMIVALVAVGWLLPLSLNRFARRRVGVTRTSSVVDGLRNESTRGPLRVHPVNPRYFADGSGRAVLLAGAHTWYTLQDGGAEDPPRPFDYEAYLDALTARHHNFFRMFAWEQARGSVLTGEPCYYAPSPYERTGPGTALDGKPKFDLTRFSETYFARLRQRVERAGARGIYVAVQLFQGFSVEAKPFMAARNPWPGHPFNKDNNVNRIDGDADGNGQGTEIHTLRVPSVTALQEAYVRKVVDSVNDLDNVLYEICNEANPESQAWQYHLIAFIKSYEATLSGLHPVGMTVEWPEGSNAELTASAADWISPNAAGGFWDDPPADAGSKVVVNDTDHLCYPCGDTSFVWRSVLRGLNPAFMDPYDCRSDIASDCDPQAPAWVNLRENLGYARALAERVDLAAMRPRPELCSTGYCLASLQANRPEYLVYLPRGHTLTSLVRALGFDRRTVRWSLPADRRVTVDLSMARGELSVDWLDTRTGTLMTGETTTGGGRRTLVAPHDGDTVLYVHVER